MSTVTPSANPDDEPQPRPSFLKRQSRHSRLYFDRNDELVTEEVAMCDQNNFYHKYHVVEVDFNDSSDDE